MAYTVGCSQGQQLSPSQIAAYAQQAGFSGQSLQLAVAIALRESCGGWTRAVGYNPSAGCNAPSSYDRGLFQINDTCWPDVSDECAFDPACAAQAAFRISRGGSNFSAWSTLQQALRDIGSGIIADFTPGGAAPVVGQGGGAPVGQTLGFPNPLDVPKNVVQWVDQQIGGLIGGLASAAAKDLLKVFSKLLGPLVNFMQRAGIFVLGGLIMLGGFIILAGGSETRTTVMNVIGKGGKGGKGGEAEEAAAAA